MFVQINGVAAETLTLREIKIEEIDVGMPSQELRLDDGFYCGGGN